MTFYGGQKTRFFQKREPNPMPSQCNHVCRAAELGGGRVDDYTTWNGPENALQETSSPLEREKKEFTIRGREKIVLLLQPLKSSSIFDIDKKKVGIYIDIFYISSTLSR